MKKSLVIILVLSFIFVGSININAISIGYGFNMPTDPQSYISSLMLADWQADYLMPIKPADLTKGEYRIYGNVANGNFKTNYEDFPNASGMNYYVGFDTALQDNLYFHLKYDVVPWQSVFEGNKDQINYKLLHTFIDYEFQKDKKFYFGYNHDSRGSKEYNTEAEEYYDKVNFTNNIIYAGFEIKGSFSK